MTCPTPHKAHHANRRDAWKHARALMRHAYGSPDLNPYLCNCGSWHVGHSQASLAFRIRKARRVGRA